MTDFYRPIREELPPLELDVVIPHRLDGGTCRVHLTATHLTYRRYHGLESTLIGEISALADPSGTQELKARRIRLKSVVKRISNLDPEVYPGGEISDSEEVAKWIDSDENEDAVWAAWHVFSRAIDEPPVKSKAEARGDRGSEDAGEARETRSVALVSAM